MYGRTLKVDLGDKFVFLPQRFAVNMAPESVAALNTIPQILTYAGKDSTRNNLCVFFLNSFIFIDFF